MSFGFRRICVLKQAFRRILQCFSHGAGALKTTSHLRSGLLAQPFEMTTRSSATKEKVKCLLNMYYSRFLTDGISRRSTRSTTKASNSIQELETIKIRNWTNRDLEVCVRKLCTIMDSILRRSKNTQEYLWAYPRAYQRLQMAHLARCLPRKPKR